MPWLALKMEASSFSVALSTAPVLTRFATATNRAAASPDSFWPKMAHDFVAQVFGPGFCGTGFWSRIFGCTGFLVQDFAPPNTTPKSDPGFDPLNLPRILEQAFL